MLAKFGDKKDAAAEAREQELWKELLQGDNRSSESARKAVAYCKDCIETYDEWFEYNEARWFSLQRVIIAGSVIATLSGAVTLPDQLLNWLPPGSYGWLRGVPAAIVTIAAGCLSSFTFKEDAVRHELTANALRNELVKFVCKASPYDDSSKEANDVSQFLDKVCRLVDNELDGWRALVTDRPKADGVK